MNYLLKKLTGTGRLLLTGFVMLNALILPAIGYSQSPPPPGPGGNGGNPDNPLGAPFDPYMNLAFLALAIVFALVILKRHQKKGLVQLQQL